MKKKCRTDERLNIQVSEDSDIESSRQRDQGVKKQTSTLGTFPVYPG